MRPNQREDFMNTRLTRRTLLAGTAAALAAPAIVRAQGGALKDGGLPDLQILNADTETNVEVARSRAEKLISDGAQLLVGAFDSGQSTAIAQVAEQKGIQ